MQVRRLLVAATAATALLVAGCSSGVEAPVSAAERAEEVAGRASVVAAAKGRTLVDVRTPAEFSAGHLLDAQNIDVQDASFETRISALPKDGSYLVYCRSGNRSAAAIARMEQLGFIDVVDGGAFDDLVAAGLPKA